jgi:hypothetical protein
VAPAPAAPAGVGAAQARRVELADIVRAQGAAYQHTHPLCRANPQRRHSALGYESPLRYERIHAPGPIMPTSAENSTAALALI